MKPADREEFKILQKIVVEHLRRIRFLERVVQTLAKKNDTLEEVVLILDNDIGSLKTRVLELEKVNDNRHRRPV